MKKYISAIIIIILVALTVIGSMYAARHWNVKPATQSVSPREARTNPLKGTTFFNDHSRNLFALAESYRAQNRPDDAAAIEYLADQPGTTWLTGPTAQDPTGQADIENVRRTSTQAAQQKTVPVYQLYAVPHRDACAGASSGGFQTGTEYLTWLDTILKTLQADAVFSVEPDGVAHLVQSDGCLTKQQIDERYSLLSQAMAMLKASPKVRAAYLDAGHSEWFPDAEKLVQPLKRAGVDDATGVAVNVSFFVATNEITPWALDLASRLGDDKGVIVDTSRNGNGVPPADVTGTARWCNPAGRAVGRVPTTNTNTPGVDAFFWGKNVGESDGDCFGNPPAGTLIPDYALSLVRNRR